MTEINNRIEGIRATNPKELLADFGSEVMANRIEEEKLIASVLLEEVMKSEVAADMVAAKVRQRLNAHGYCQLFPQPLEDKELEKAIQDILDTAITVDNQCNEITKKTQILALLQPKTEEAKAEGVEIYRKQILPTVLGNARRQERERIAEAQRISLDMLEMEARGRGLVKRGIRIATQVLREALKGGE